MQGKVHFLNNAKRKERVTTTKQKSKLKKYLLSGEGRRRDKMKIRNKIRRAAGTHFLDGMGRRTKLEHGRNVTN